MLRTPRKRPWWARGPPGLGVWKPQQPALSWRAVLHIYLLLFKCESFPRKQKVSSKILQGVQSCPRVFGGLNCIAIFRQPAELTPQIPQVGWLGKVMISTRLIPFLDVFGPPFGSSDDYVGCLIAVGRSYPFAECQAGGRWAVPNRLCIHPRAGP